MLLTNHMKNEKETIMANWCSKSLENYLKKISNKKLPNKSLFLCTQMTCNCLFSISNWLSLAILFWQHFIMILNLSQFLLATAASFQTRNSFANFPFFSLILLKSFQTVIETSFSLGHSFIRKEVCAQYNVI